ncbi:M23 family metallopeptidase [Alkaliphilus hydrothermalis]|uniref:Murein DD-endopeptidase MepM/ murein hydrolase activator NlpD n=1 Tax=Alkaliphilus hydrothermalis TaxID=1482730 RepID=A0ABS2NPH7_9FIRM|nr:murein DD-endopeptidase MepM/ murein hydrolase activator NlpD [Alkaliphilus hydrothermalis]
MKKITHSVHKNKKILSFTLIPSTTNQVVHFSIPYWIPILSLSIILLTGLYAVGVSKEYIKSQEELNTAQLSLVQLKTENATQAAEISFLKNRSAEIENKLLALNELQNKVLNMVGLEEAAVSSITPPTFLISRSDARNSNSEETLDEDLSSLNNLIEQQTNSMEKLVVDVEKQLKYIDSLPNLRPATGRLSSPYGYRISPISRRREFHSGIDIANTTNTDIVAAGSGIVTFSGYNGGYGKIVMISHGYGYTTVYAHNNKVLVKVGDRVKKGDLIAQMGSTGRSTGPHLHFEIRKDGKHINPKTVLE